MHYILQFKIISWRFSRKI